MIVAALAALVATSVAAGKPAEKSLDLKPSTSTSQNIDPGDWPQWRGPYRDGISEETGLLDSWPQEGPPLAWKLTGLGQDVAAVVTCKVAQGFDMGERASPVVDNGQVVGCTGNSTFFGIDADGKLMWKINARTDLRGDMQHMYGYSETPLVDGDQVVFTPGASWASTPRTASACGATTASPSATRTYPRRWPAATPSSAPTGTAEARAA